MTDRYGHGWAKGDERFDIAKNPNEPNRAGYIVEIDPMRPRSTPKKRTAQGRFKHENAELVIAENGRVVVYMGDDEHVCPAAVTHLHPQLRSSHVLVHAFPLIVLCAFLRSLLM